MTERTFDRVPQFDERSKQYPIRTLVADKPLRSYTWNGAPHLDQGSEGACVGFGWAHEAGARPVVRRVTDLDALSIYWRARQLDEWDGEDYDGTSVLAGAKAMKEAGLIREYRWAFGFQDVLLSLGYKGPVVIGVNWYEGMFDTDDSGYLQPNGKVLGGHCVMLKGVNVKGRYVVVHNSWGPDWGVGGDAKLSWDALGFLLRDQGEACVPVLR